MKPFVMVLAAAASLGSGVLLAQSYPSKPVRIVVPFPVGSAPDALSRAVGAQLAASMHQQFVVDTRLGAGGNIAYEHVAKSAPDGYTLLLGANSLVINRSLYKSLAYDTLKDFSPVILAAFSPTVVAVHPSVPANSLGELVALAKSKPGQLTFGSAGNGTLLHIAGEIFKMETGTDLVHVPYRGSAFSVTDLVGGRISMVFASIPSVRPAHASGKVRALAVTGERRSGAIPEVPTFAEAGEPNAAIPAWFGYFVPAGTPAAVVARLHEGVAAAMADPDMQGKMSDMGLILTGKSAGSPDQYAAFMRSEITRMAKVVKASGAKLD